MPHGRPAKRRRITPPLDDSAVSETIKSSDLFSRAADWDLEQDYERQSRRKRVKETTKLPIKTAEGRVQQVQNSTQTIEDDSDSFLGSGSDGEVGQDGIAGNETPPTEDGEEALEIPVRQQVLAAKEELARLAGLLNEDPEEYAGSFKRLGQIGGEAAPISVQKLVLAAQAAVYRDAIPGYRIRAYTDEELGNKVSKEIRKQRQYEHALISGYQAYVKQLATLAKTKSTNPEQASLRSVAIKCASSLLLSVPHFNFRTELLNIFVHELASRVADDDFHKCVETIQDFFKNDEDGAPSLEAVTLLAKMMKVKDYRIREEVLNTFFHLRLLSELAPASSNNDRAEREKPNVRGKRARKEQWEHRSKKERKIARDRKAVAQEMREADAAVNYEERDKMQSETLKMVFVAYFRILKERVPHLVGAVLEGLAKYAHLINQDLFGDILEALREIIEQADAVIKGTAPENVEEETTEEVDATEARDRTREILLSTQTAFTLLSSQEVSRSASALHLDLSYFTSHIYRSVYSLSVDADIELGPKSLRLPDPHASTSRSFDNNKINISTPVLLLTRVLTSILLTPSQPPPTMTAASFFKRLLTAVLQLPEKSALAVLTLMTKVAEKHGRKIEPLWYSDERKGDGTYNGESETVEGTNVLSVGSGVWESELLRHHYCPQVRQQVENIDKVIASLAS